ncbi:unnamed protein product [Mycena citricolor]|uniref:Uncharacterized protein n=1 Tax=Mycena citricolor TaxID=2018698 RepID=A0AAD2Q0L3_9AGAR|nr:unnamed protein product [Mycena citricolor]
MSESESSAVALEEPGTDSPRGREESDAASAPSEETGSEPQLEASADANDAPDHEPPPSTEALPVAAPEYPWLYMNSTLDACFQDAEADLTERTKQVTLEDVEPQVPPDGEQPHPLQFYNEMETDKLAPALMQAFLAHGDACTSLEADVMQLAMCPPEQDPDFPMRQYDDMLEKLENLQDEYDDLQASITMLIQAPDPSSKDEDADGVARSQLVRVFSACLPVLQARTANLEMAQQLLEGTRENMIMSLHMESMEFTDEEDEERFIASI